MAQSVVERSPVYKPVAPPGLAPVSDRAHVTASIGSGNVARRRRAILCKAPVDPEWAGSSSQMARQLRGDGARGSPQEGFSDAFHVYRHTHHRRTADARAPGGDAQPPRPG